MNVRNRMTDVNKLRCNVCQDFLKMYLTDGWQHKLYAKAQSEVQSGKRRDKYIATYEKMRDCGIDNFQISQMDITFICELVIAKFEDTVRVKSITRKALKLIREDRCDRAHSDENEEQEELYLCGLLALCNLRNFIRTVDRYELSIEDSCRLSFRQKYMPKIEQLKAKLDEERIESIQWNKSITQDIRRILESTDPQKTWIKVEKIYMDRYWKLEKDSQKCFEFFVRASDAGIPAAHLLAADYYILMKNYAEAERRLFMCYSGSTEFSTPDVHTFLETINFMVVHKVQPSEGILKMILGLQEKGFKIEKGNNGIYKLTKTKK